MSPVKAGRIAVLILLAVIVIFPETSFSQNEPKSNSGCKDCFNAKRFPACCSYWVIDAGVGIFTSSFGYSHSSIVMGFTDLGFMINLNEKTSMGGTLFGAFDEDRHRAGVRFRYRRWLGDKTTLDFSPGILVLGGHSSAEALWPGFIATAHISYNSRVNGYVGMEIFRVNQFTYNYSPPYDVSFRKSTETSFFVGVGVGQEPAIVGLGAFGVVIAVAAIMLFGDPLIEY